MIKYYKICIDGIDKTGKDIIKKYVYLLTKGKYLVYDRGIISQKAYSEIFNRNYKYDISENETLNIYLTVNYDDWKIRCKINNEPEINYEKQILVFNKIYQEVSKLIPVITFNTSDETPINIAKQIVNKIEELNDENK